MLADLGAALAAWNDLTPLARNEWVCWIISVRKAGTRNRHIERACEALTEGEAASLLLAGLSASVK